MEDKTKEVIAAGGAALAGSAIAGSAAGMVADSLLSDNDVEVVVNNQQDDPEMTVRPGMNHQNDVEIYHEDVVIEHETIIHEIDTLPIDTLGDIIDPEPPVCVYAGPGGFDDEVPNFEPPLEEFDAPAE